MNSNWKNRPTAIDFVDRGINWVIAIDESGSSDLKHVNKAIQIGKEIVHSEKHLTVTASLISALAFNDIKNAIMEIKYKYWQNGLFEYQNGVKRVCFHSRDIRRKEGAFSPNKIDYINFTEDLGNFIQEAPLKLFVANVDKEKHVRKYKYPDSPYELCITFILERIMMNIPDNENCVLLFEAIGKTEDKQLLEKTKVLISRGNEFNEKHKFSKIKGVYFNPKWCRKENNKKSYWPLEVADLCAYPIHKYIAYGTIDKAFKIIEKKIFHYPHYQGYGLKMFP